MFSTPRTADEILKEMWEYQSLDLGRHYLADDAWDANRDASVVVKHGDGAWRLYVDGAAYGEPFPDRISACQAGHELIATEVEVQARAMARHDVPVDLWEAGVVATQFRHRQNRDVTMYHSTGRWFVILGQCPFGQYSSAREASIALLKDPPIDPASIRLLETIYGRSSGHVCQLQDMETLAEIGRQGFVSITGTEDNSTSPVALLTEKGRAAINADPRGLASSCATSFLLPRRTMSNVQNGTDTSVSAPMKAMAAISKRRWRLASNYTWTSSSQSLMNFASRRTAPSGMDNQRAT